MVNEAKSVQPMNTYNLFHSKKTKKTSENRGKGRKKRC